MRQAMPPATTAASRVSAVLRSRRGSYVLHTLAYAAILLGMAWVYGRGPMPTSGFIYQGF